MTTPSTPGRAGRPAPGGGEVLDYDRIKAAGVNMIGLGQLPTGEWVAYHRTDTTRAVTFAATGVDENDVQWWGMNYYVDGEPHGDDEFPSLTQLLDRVARETR